ncbi:MAG: 5'-3' exonuclease [Candidatus Anammoxibacter sp.]
MSEVKFYLIDGHAMLFQAYYAIPALTTPKGDPANAVYGFTSMLRRLIKKLNPYYLAVTFDSGGPTFRHKHYSDYKATRKPMPEDLKPQLSLLERIIDTYDIPRFACDGYEADDIMGTIAKELTKNDIETFIVTRDKDIEQLIDKNINLLDIKTHTVYDMEMFEAKRGVKPTQMIDILALVGDRSDNVPGVPGIGYKTATKLIAEWKSVEGVMANIDKIKAGKTKENLIQYEEQAKLSKYLVTINTEVPIAFDLEKCRMNGNGINDQAINDVFEEFGFKSFLN